MDSINGIIININETVNRQHKECAELQKPLLVEENDYFCQPQERQYIPFNSEQSIKRGQNILKSVETETGLHDMERIDQDNMERMEPVDMAVNGQGNMEVNDQGNMKRIDQVDMERIDQVDMERIDQGNMERIDQGNMEVNGQGNMEVNGQGNMEVNGQGNMERIAELKQDISNYKCEIHFVRVGQITTVIGCSIAFGLALSGVLTPDPDIMMLSVILIVTTILFGAVATYYLTIIHHYYSKKLKEAKRELALLLR